MPRSARGARHLRRRPYRHALGAGAVGAGYREAYRAAGHPGEGEVYLRVPVYIAETEERARREPEESVMHLFRTIGGQLEASANLSGARAIEERAERGRGCRPSAMRKRCATR